ncbi:hypothetical protein CERZMDRAFT_100407 [Cercospora zeae-maydis SCOH1-5]|uniref:CFEM domain-containing protein n=1 Tax=Cercospora zeae-maydis SCOH1-5 TaxID=717836 RepID=A0A6A6F6P4_9PEZI|nr:hypothetical protein CERZMDRAFT_100407 [Cercospora zeae-maydis SCOH1-5]
MPDLSKIPPCALQCLTQAATSSSCQLTDIYCQCTTGEAAIAKVLVPCLCASTCSPSDLMGTLSVTGELCMSALAAKGETFKIPNVSPDLCSTMGSSSAPSGGSPPPSNMESPTTPETSTSSPPAGYAPITNMTPSTSGPTMTTGSNSTNKTRPPIEQSTGDAASVHGGRMFGTAAIAALVCLAMAVL